MDVLDHNRRAWNRQSSLQESPWVQPVSAADIDAAAKHDWEVILTPTLNVPKAWFGRPDGNLSGLDLLALASGCGQQAPLLAAAGARVLSYDMSEEQLAKDQKLADTHQLPLTCQQGDMANLAGVNDDSFDVIFHPVSNVFAKDIVPVWRECARVLRPGGRLLAGFMNPTYYLFDHDAIEAGADMQVTFSLPFADTEQLSKEQIDERLAAGYAVEFSHSLDTQIGAQIDAGFALHGFYEDRWSDGATPLNQYMPTSMATLGKKL